MELQSAVKRAEIGLVAKNSACKRTCASVKEGEGGRVGGRESMCVLWTGIGHSIRGDREAAGCYEETANLICSWERSFKGGDCVCLFDVILMSF